MATNKDELIARLKQLGEQLGRELNTSGTVAELELRLREAEEEMAALADSGTDDAGTDGDKEKAPVSEPEKTPPPADTSPATTAQVTLVALKTVHINGEDLRGKPVAIVVAGESVRIATRYADAIAPGLFRRA